jgi:hypothetical protein
LETSSSIDDCAHISNHQSEAHSSFNEFQCPFLLFFDIRDTPKIIGPEELSHGHDEEDAQANALNGKCPRVK